MKKVLLALTLLITLPLVSNGQMWLTVKGGGGLALINGYNGTQGGINTNFGLGYKHQISKRMMLEGDILLDSRTVTYPTGILDEDDKEIFFTGGGTYIQVPITLQYIIPFRKKELIPYRVGQPKSYWFIEGGPYVSYGTSVSTLNNQAILDAWADPELDTFTTEDLTPRQIDVGITAGVGVNFSLGDAGNTRLIVGTRTNIGFINMYRDARLGSATNFNAVGYIALDFSLTKRRHIRHRW